MNKKSGTAKTQTNGNQEEVGEGREDRFYKASARSFQQERSRHCENTRVEESVTEGTRLRNANAYILHQSRWQESHGVAQAGT